MVVKKWYKKSLVRWRGAGARPRDVRVEKNPSKNKYVFPRHQILSCRSTFTPTPAYILQTQSPPFLPTWRRGGACWCDVGWGRGRGHIPEMLKRKKIHIKITIFSKKQQILSCKNNKKPNKYWVVAPPPNSTRMAEGGGQGKNTLERSICLGIFFSHWAFLYRQYGVDQNLTLISMDGTRRDPRALGR